MRSKWAAGKEEGYLNSSRDLAEQWFKAAPLQMDRADRRRKCEIPGAEEGKFIEMMLAETKPVLIVGAGPTGMTAAMELARLGIPVRLIDKKPAPDTTWRAIGNPGAYARTLRAAWLDRRDLIQQHEKSQFNEHNPRSRR